MTFAYPPNTGASSPYPLPLYRQKQTQSPNPLSRLADFISPVVKQWLPMGDANGRLRRAKDDGLKLTAVKLVKGIFTLPNAIILLWIFSIRWGERTVFEDHINQCLWDSWEDWVSIAHHRNYLLVVVTVLRIGIINSPKMQGHIILHSSPTPSSLIPTLTPVDPGLCRR